MLIFNKILLKSKKLSAKNPFKNELIYQSIIRDLPGIIYWKDISGRYLGCNQYAADLMQKSGVTKTNEIANIIGKTDFDLFDKTTAEQYQENDRLVIKSKKAITQEEQVTLPDGNIMHQLSVKRPLYDETGDIIGVIGNTIDITPQKEAEHLRLEHEQNAKFKKIADQVAHDIRSPLASLLMLVKSCKELPEVERIAFREVAMTIEDIANNLLSQYKAKEYESTLQVEERQPLLVSAMLLQLLTDKKYQYQEQPIKFEHNFTQKGNFAFIKVEGTALKRSISNVINNAVDAMEKKEEKITLKLDATKEWVKISIQDNGKGMPPELVDKIMKNIAVTEGKDNGHGIGLTQVRETLQHNQGELAIDSAIGKGTKITLTFPRIKAPSWIAESIKLGREDVVIILDDDSSIHTAWDTNFSEILKQAPNIKIKHFQEGKKALEFINGLAPQEKEKIFLLTDYELLKQELNGLHVVEQGKIKRSVLVTSHYANTTMQDQAAKTGTKILPKQLASEVPILIDEGVKYSESTNVELKHVDLIIVDDDQSYAQNMINLVFSDLVVDHYTSPENFLAEAAKYPKDTKICLDQNFKGSRMDGLYLAEQLNQLGYTKLYLISGEEFDKKKMPKYLKILQKTNIGEVLNL